MKLRQTYIAILALLATSCSSDDGVLSEYLSGDGNKTPVDVNVSLNDGAVVSRATDNKFESGDKLLAYVRHVTWEGKYTNKAGNKETNSYSAETPLPKGASSVSADKAPALVTFAWQSKQETTTSYTPSYSTTNDLVATYKVGETIVNGLYWDDMSNSANADTDLRTDGHYLQSYYGYCFNGGEGDNNEEGTTVKGNITSALNSEAGTLGWQVPTVQTTAAAVKQADLLWSGEQTPIRYEHSTSNPDGDHNTLNLPYTHANSEVTIIVKTGAGFEDVYADALTNTTVDLIGWNKKGTFTAPSQDVSETILSNTNDTDATKGKINTCKNTTIETDATNKSATATFKAITIPKTSLSLGNTIATIKDADGNNYDIKVTSAILAGWGTELEDGGKENIQDGVAQAKSRAGESLPMGTAKTTKPGVNYVLTVTINKVKVSVEASISNWKNVYAETSATTEFDKDKSVVSFEFPSGTYTTGDKFSLFALNSKNAGSDLNAALQGASAVNSTATYDASAADGKKWACSPIIYWPNSTDALYFRALSYVKDGKYYSYTSPTVSQGTDVVWATTAKHTASLENGATKEYNAGDPIDPRYLEVPLQMEHAMSKITINLETATGEGSSPTSAAVTLEGAKIEILDIATSGTINIANGNITSATDLGNIAKTAAPMSNYCVIPQTIGNTAIIRITLANGAIYKAQLNKCVETGTETLISTWERGKHYTYTIYLEKEEITFRVVVKDWTNTTGSGNANLEWD